jgi:ribosomal protein S18 acetylase RimI-like enzyme
MQNLSLLKVSPEYLSPLQQLSAKTFIDTYAQFNTEEDMQNYIATEFSDEKLLADINSPHVVFYLAMEGNVPVGYIKVNYTTSQTDVNDGKSLELERIYVLKEHQGKKIGQFLLDAARDIAVKSDLDYLWLGVWDKNTNAQQFYAKNGFTAFGTHDFMLGNDRQTDILLRLSLRN